LSYATEGSSIPPAAGGANWDNWQSYVTINQCPWPHSSDACVRQVPQHQVDRGVIASVGAAQPAGASALVMAYRSISPQVVDVEVTAHYNVNPLAGYENILKADVTQPDPTAYAEATAALANRPQVDETQSVGAKLWEDAKELGGDVVNYLSSFVPSISSIASTVAGWIFKEKHVDAVLRLYHVMDPKVFQAEVRAIVERGAMPVELGKALLALSDFKVAVTGTGYVFKSLSTGDVFDARLVLPDRDIFGDVSNDEIKSVVEEKTSSVRSGFSTPEYVGHPSTHRGFLKGGCAACVYDTETVFVVFHGTHVEVVHSSPETGLCRSSCYDNWPTAFEEVRKLRCPVRLVLHGDFESSADCCGDKCTRLTVERCVHCVESCREEVGFFTGLL